MSGLPQLDATTLAEIKAAARDYVEAQIGIMRAHGSAPNLSSVEMDALVERVAQYPIRLRRQEKRAATRARRANEVQRE